MMFCRLCFGTILGIGLFAILESLVPAFQDPCDAIVVSHFGALAIGESSP